MDKSVEETVVETLQDLGVEEEQQSKELNEFEQEQQAKGWNPNGSKSAEEWARAEPLYEEIKQRGKQLKRMERTIEEMKTLMSKQENAAYQRAMEELMSNRDAAISVGDISTVKQLDQQIAATKPVALPLPNAAIDFIERNKSWYEGNSSQAMRMTEFAKREDQYLAADRLDPDEHMEELEKRIHKQFPDYFNKSETRSQSVESGNGSSNVVRSDSGKRKYSLKDLTQEQKQAARDFERLGVMTIDKYIDELVKVGDLK